jgi:hypothetical protein
MRLTTPSHSLFLKISLRNKEKVTCHPHNLETKSNYNLNYALNARKPHKRGRPPQNVLKKFSNNVHKSLKYVSK